MRPPEEQRLPLIWKDSEKHLFPQLGGRINKRAKQETPAKIADNCSIQFCKKLLGMENIFSCNIHFFY